MPSPPNRNLRFSSRSSSATSPNAATSFPACPESASGCGDGGSSQIPSPDPAATATAAVAAPALASRRGAAAAAEADAEKAREDPSRRMAERTDDKRVNAEAMASHNMTLYEKRHPNINADINFPMLSCEGRRSCDHRPVQATVQDCEAQCFEGHPRLLAGSKKGAGKKAFTVARRKYQCLRACSEWRDYTGFL
uniref:Uncharacterized protein n=1 Tax=Oryza meridionalis TaxID=40149 RepID=A0A0E0CND4_9ORYZ